LLAKGCFGDPTALPAATAFAMATILGAQALHMSDVIGSIEPVKRADLAVVSLDGTHQLPAFERDPDAIYSRLVYATKSNDVRDVMVNGQMLMRDRRLLTLDEQALHAEARQFARRIDAFLVAREGSLLSKLLAIGSGVVPQETYEIQVKVRIADVDIMRQQLQTMQLGITRSSTRNQYDTYLLFKDGQQGRLRYREDELLDDTETVRTVHYTLTFMAPVHEKEYDHSVVLTRSRYTAPADRSLRFYREYFKPDAEKQVVKHRHRFHITFQDTDFAVNLDQVMTPPGGSHFLEIKARTWSARDADHKAHLIGDLLDMMEISTEDRIKMEYLDLVP